MKRVLRVVLLLVLVAGGALFWSFLPANLPMPAPIADALPPASPPAGMSISVLDTGSIQSRAVLAFRGGAFGDERTFAMAPILVRHPRGDLLIDAGFGRDIDAHVKTMPWLGRMLTDYTKGTPAGEQLAGAGMSPASLKGVLITHAHYDHVSGLDSLAGAPVWVNDAERAFIDGDDTPWSKGFLASSYASRGLKMRFTSGSGSEVQMGYAEGKSMLYLEARCIYITKAAGVQGLQNGSVSCIGVPSAVPSGIRAVLAENLICSSLDLECASSNDQTFTHSDMRRTARLLMQFLPGTDFISSGYSAVPNYDNMFAGSNEDAEDFDDYNVIQRDLKVDGGLRPVREEDVIAIRNKAARALQAVFAGMGLPPITDEEVEAATYAHGSKDMPERNIVEDIKFAQEIINKNRNGLEVVKALAQGGFTDVAQDMLNIQKAKLTGDYLHTSAIIVGGVQVLSAVNDVNDYAGPATGYRLQGERWEEIKNIPGALDPNELG